ncbi:DUF2663 family protein [Alkalihalobacillus trypoxylicola]|uniref:DUF2663 domain-containing protein n=1 Tax=Alkalihalobacillus trypoxylicola TaxID=519424 RepID=A0A162EKP6_9BACI|nr:DUF2663 family protein [Alkalihalobacillus trypoxylicola]KYG33137.1 hypothetical protein AZF04_17480 [Alkalihalobacillus trypoxylicola]GAF65335.1 hypothetical protein BTS2_2233 [Bacillus sp. TS-2]
MGTSKKNNNTPKYFQFMLTELINRKKKMDKHEKAKINWSIFVFTSMAIAFIYIIYTYFIHTASTNIRQFFTLNTSTILLIMITTLGVLQVKYFKKKEEKAEKEYEELRLEIIERSPEFWQEDQDWSKRHLIFTQIKSENDINLFHK